MRCSIRLKLATLAAIAMVFLSVALCIWYQNDDSHHDAQTIAKAASLPKDRLGSIQRELRNARDFYAELRITVGYQGPYPVQIAWRKPHIVFIHIAALLDNPEVWYWFENQQLCVYEKWPARGSRGVCVTNVLPISECNAERAFELILSKSESLAYYGNLGLRLLQLIQDVAVKRLDIKESETMWQLTAETNAFDAKLIKPFQEGSNDRTFVVFELPRTATMATIDTIRVETEGYPPEAGVIATFEALQFSFDRERLKFPKPPPGLMKTIEVKDVDALNSEIIDSLRPTPIAENGG